MCSGKVGTTLLIKEKKIFGWIDSHPLRPGLRQSWLCMASFVCPCTTKCRESKISPYPKVGRGLALTGDCTANHIQQKCYKSTFHLFNF